MARKPIPKDAQQSVLVASRRRCCVCFGFHRDMGIKQGQIAHLDRNRGNHDENNLAFICLEHHDWYDTKPSQSKALTVEEVRHFHAELVKALAGLPKEDEASPKLFSDVPLIPGQRPNANYPAFLGVKSLRNEDERIFLNEIPTTMTAAVKHLPPLAREKAADDAFSGRWVRWCGAIFRVGKGDECYTVHVLVGQETVSFRPLAMLTFPLSWLRDVEPLREDDYICFEGQIRHAYEHLELVFPVITKHLRPGNSVVQE